MVHKLDDKSYENYLQHFNAVKYRDEVTQWIRNKMNNFNPNSVAVIGISGGKDSSIVAALCVRALGRDRVVGVMMPNGVQSDIADSERLINHLNIKSQTINIKGAYESLISELNCCPSNSAEINLPPRLRMAALYMVAQTITNAYVVNTCNLSEDWVGYSTWHGDTAGDFSPLASFTSDEVIAIGDECELPYDLTHKTPSDGLCGKTDEDNLGFTYKELNAYIRCNIHPAPEIKKKIDTLHQNNLFKLLPLDTYRYTYN